MNLSVESFEEEMKTIAQKTPEGTGFLAVFLDPESRDNCVSVKGHENVLSTAIMGAFQQSKPFRGVLIQAMAGIMHIDKDIIAKIKDEASKIEVRQRTS